MAAAIMGFSALAMGVGNAATAEGRIDNADFEFSRSKCEEVGKGLQEQGGLTGLEEFECRKAIGLVTGSPESNHSAFETREACETLREALGEGKCRRGFALIRLK